MGHKPILSGSTHLLPHTFTPIYALDNPCCFCLPVCLFICLLPGRIKHHLIVSKCRLITLLFRIIQFFIQLGCSKTQTPDLVTEPVLLQYSTNGGISWKTVEQFSFSEHTVTPKYIALHMPPKARTNSTRIRWWQPSVDGTFQQEWAIDQVKI